MQNGLFMFTPNSSQKINEGTERRYDFTGLEASILQKLLKKTQNENQLHRANIQRLLEQHKKLSSLTKKLIQILETESMPAEKQASLNRQIKLFKRSIDF